MNYTKIVTILFIFTKKLLDFFLNISLLEVDLISLV